MKPVSIILSINLAFLAVLGLLFVFVFNRPEMIPLFTSLQAAINLLGAGVFLLDRRKPIMWGFLINMVLLVALTLVGYYLISIYGPGIGVDEFHT